MKITVGLVALLTVGMVHGLTQEGESYQANPGIRCLGHDIKRHTADIEGCEEACDSLPDCIGFVHSDDGSRGYCNLKKDTCLSFINRKKGLTMFVKPKKVPFFFHLPMEEILRSGTAYTIIGGINGTLHNHPQLFDGKKGKALVFGGHRRAQFARFRLVPCFGDLEQCGDGGYSTAMWLSVQYLKNGCFLSSGAETGTSRTGGIAVLIKGGKLQVEIRSYAAQKAWVSSGLTISTNRWFHLAVVWDGTVMKFYFDGELKETVEASTVPEQYWAAESEMWLKLASCNGHGTLYSFFIDEWYYWNNVLSDKSIQKVYALDK